MGVRDGVTIPPVTTVALGIDDATTAAMKTNVGNVVLAPEIGTEAARKGATTVPVTTMPDEMARNDNNCNSPFLNT